MMMLAIAVAVCILTGIGLWEGRCLSRGRLWGWGVGLPLMVIGLTIMGHRSARLAFIPPVSWVTDARVEPWMMAGSIACLLSVLGARLPRRRQRVAVYVLMGAMIGYYGILPVVLPLSVRGDLLAGKTRIDLHGVCLQTHGYTCGPAAAVTCLRMLNVPAEEGPLGVDSGTAPVVGTDGAQLARAINRIAVARGVQCEYRFVATLESLSTPAIATIVSPRYGGHYVAVLEVTPDEVIIGDPLSGRDRMTREEFMGEWTGAAHLFNRGAHHSNQ